MRKQFACVLPHEWQDRNDVVASRCDEPSLRLHIRVSRRCDRDDEGGLLAICTGSFIGRCDTEPFDNCPPFVTVAVHQSDRIFTMPSQAGQDLASEGTCPKEDERSMGWSHHLIELCALSPRG